MELTKYEITRILSARTEQIACGAPPLVKIMKNDTSYDLAKRELEEKKMPLAVLRIKNGKKEIVSVS
ncbi:MAG TPA: DNA-directed RNA polymerase subunit omega [archaeon]|jgi:DNA-directed RNA polymerase subunit K/omega|nr:DNA-directed RNA polymerase subunit omega [archaeon]HPC09906.1 DNA-directed RNA polymerase subunit omega [archaeon]HRT02657.1 DNA-directed RNA polymerase subunit omega [Candidatus Diapherotrites archaeon]